MRKGLQITLTLSRDARREKQQSAASLDGKAAVWSDFHQTPATASGTFYRNRDAAVKSHAEERASPNGRIEHISGGRERDLLVGLCSFLINKDGRCEYSQK